MKTKEEIKQELLNDPEAMRRAQFIKAFSEASPTTQEIVKRAIGLRGSDEQKKAMEEIDAILQERKQGNK